jgi:hypothetical protein
MSYLAFDFFKLKLHYNEVIKKKGSRAGHRIVNAFFYRFKYKQMEMWV